MNSIIRPPTMHSSLRPTYSSHRTVHKVQVFKKRKNLRQHSRHSRHSQPRQTIQFYTPNRSSASTMNQSTNEPNESNELVRTLPVANHAYEENGNEVESFTLGTSGCVFLYNNNCPSDPVVISCVR
eukprot:m.128685 g.128685  ORF g.128685 m.128685 type:complete len:126 (+) comp29351_c1_seq4:337-714(+)